MVPPAAGGCTEQGPQSCRSHAEVPVRRGFLRFLRPPVPRPAPCAPPPLHLPRVPVPVPDRGLALPEVPPVVLACESSALAGAAGGDTGTRRRGCPPSLPPGWSRGSRPTGRRGPAHPLGQPRGAGGRQVPADHRDAAVVRCPDVRAFVVPVGIAPYPGAFLGRRSDNAGGSGPRFRAAASSSVLPHRRLPNGEGVPLLGAATCGDESREPAISLPEHMSVPPGEGRAPPPWN